MPYEIVVPRLGLTMEEGRIVQWHKEEGEEIEAGEPLFSVETDKAILDVEAAVSGRVHPLRDLPSDPLPIGRLIGYILAPGEGVPSANREGGSDTVRTRPADSRPTPLPQKMPTAPSRKRASPAARRRAKELGIDWQTIELPGDGPISMADVERAAQGSAGEERVKATPASRRLAEEAGIDLKTLSAARPGGRIRLEDVEAAIDARGQASDVPSSAPVKGEVLPLSQIRRVIAERMAESAHTSAAVTLDTEADATELVAFRERLKASLRSRGTVPPTYTDLMVKLTSVALAEHPMLNAAWHDGGVMILKEIHIAVAVDTEAGLLVPVVRDVPSKSIQMIAEETRSLAEKARSHQLGPDDLQGGTFTITNLGVYGIDTFSPIINPPQCAILGIGRIISKPAVWKDEVVPRERVSLSLTFDHRMVDGGPAARFLNRVREYVEEPYLWLVR